MFLFISKSVIRIKNMDINSLKNILSLIEEKHFILIFRDEFGVSELKGQTGLKY